MGQGGSPRGEEDATRTAAVRPTGQGKGLTKAPSERKMKAINKVKAMRKAFETDESDKQRSSLGAAWGGPDPGRPRGSRKVTCFNAFGDQDCNDFKILCNYPDEP